MNSAMEGTIQGLVFLHDIAPEDSLRPPQGKKTGSPDRYSAHLIDEHGLMLYRGKRRYTIYSVSQMVLIQYAHSENVHSRQYGVEIVFYRQDIESKFEVLIFLFLLQL